MRAAHRNLGDLSSGEGALREGITSAESASAKPKVGRSQKGIECKIHAKKLASDDSILCFYLGSIIIDGFVKACFVDAEARQLEHRG